MRIATAALVGGVILAAAGIGYHAWHAYDSSTNFRVAAKTEPVKVRMATSACEGKPSDGVIRKCEPAEGVALKPEVLLKRIEVEAPPPSVVLSPPPQRIVIGSRPRPTEPTAEGPAAVKSVSVAPVAVDSKPEPPEPERPSLAPPTPATSTQTAAKRAPVEPATARPPTAKSVGPSEVVAKFEIPAETPSSAPPPKRTGLAAVAPPTAPGVILTERELEEHRRQAMSPTELALHDQLEATLKDAHYAFNHPSILYLSRRAQVTLTLAPTDRQAIDALKEQFDRPITDRISAGRTTYAPIMSATLRGRAFEIEPAGEQVKGVLLSTKGPIEWTWFVEPLEAGKGQILVLELAAKITASGSTIPIRVNTFVARIDVDVRIWDRVLFEARRMTPIAQALTGLGGFAAFIGFIGTVVRWVRPQKTSSPSTPPPLPSSRSARGAGLVTRRKPGPPPRPTRMA